jgi:hypothetical protein
VWVHFGITQTIVSDRDIWFLNTFWSRLWSRLDTNITKFTAFHPQTDGQIEVVSRMIMHILRMYNSNHLCTWDESLPYVQHSYNRSIHRSTDHNPFQVGLVFQPLGPMDVTLPLASTHEESSHAQTKAKKSIQFIEQIQHIRQHVQDILQKSDAKYKQRHDQHQVPHKFQVGDKVWLHLQKERLTGPIGSFVHSVMDLIPSPRMWVTMIFSSTFLPSLDCTQCLMWTSFSHTFHHYWTPQR